MANDKLSFILYDVFTEEECEEFIKEAEKKLLKKPQLTLVGTIPELRKDVKSGRCVIKSLKKANEIWSRIRFNIPKN